MHFDLASVRAKHLPDLIKILKDIPTYGNTFCKFISTQCPGLCRIDHQYKKLINYT